MNISTQIIRSHVKETELHLTVAEVAAKRLLEHFKIKPDVAVYDLKKLQGIEREARGI